MLLVSSLATICYAELQDPTIPPWYTGEVSTRTQGMVVSSVIVSPTRRIAVVNGKTVRVGDRIEDVQVVAITRPLGMRVLTTNISIMASCAAMSIPSPPLCRRNPDKH